MTGRILIVDDLATSRIVLKVKLSAARYHVEMAETIAAAKRMARAQRPKLVVLSAEVEGREGSAACRRLRAEPALAGVPIIVVGSQGTLDRTAQLRAGAEEALTRPLDEKFLLARIRSLLRGSDAVAELELRESTSRALGFAEAATPAQAEGVVGVLSEETARGLRIAEGLRAVLPHRVEAIDPEDALEGTDADILLIDAAGPERGAGPAAVSALVPELRTRAATRHCGILALLRPGDLLASVLALDLGVDDVVPEDAEREEFALRIQAQLARKHARDQLRRHVRDGLQMAVTDPLTGVFNRRYALSHLERQAEKTAAAGTPLTVMVLDLDRFKAVNDGWGHAGGDAVLVAVAHRLRDKLRGADMLGRIGGEEFMIVMPDTPLPRARRVAERLCREVAATPVAYEGVSIPVTVSIGVAHADGAKAAVRGAEDGPAMARRLLAAADRALYGAKGGGRDRVTVDLDAA